MSAQAHPTVTSAALGALNVWARDSAPGSTRRECPRRELDEARATAEALRQANQQLIELLQIASHELRAPLTTITASEQLAARRLGALREALRRDPAASAAHARAAERARGALTQVDQQVHRLSRLVDDLLDAARAQSGKLEPPSRPCDLVAIVREVVAEYRVAWPARRILIALPGEGAGTGYAVPVTVVADPTRLTRVVVNFLTNALKFSPADRPVELRLDVDSGVARIAVRDEGPGLPDTERERVWERFHQGEDAVGRGHAEAGLGLGLYIARGIIARYGGRVGVRTAPGQGATFWCELPLAPTAESAGQPQP